MNLAVRLCFWILGIEGRHHALAQVGELHGVFMGAEVDACWTGLQTRPTESADLHADGRGAAAAANDLHAQRRP